MESAAEIRMQVEVVRSVVEEKKDEKPIGDDDSAKETDKSENSDEDDLMRDIDFTKAAD